MVGVYYSNAINFVDNKICKNIFQAFLKSITNKF